MSEKWDQEYMRQLWVSAAVKAERERIIKEITRGATKEEIYSHDCHTLIAERLAR
jgi:hypothetical protein